MTSSVIAVSKYGHLSTSPGRGPARRGPSAPDEGLLLGGAPMKRLDTFTSPIGPSITRYLAMKRALGRSAVQMAYIFRYLDRFLVSYRAADLNCEAFTAWGESMASLHPNTGR